VNELRRDPITDRWVIISTERGKRPTDFKAVQQEHKGGFCPFDEGNEKYVPKEIYAIRDKNSKPNGKGWKLRVVPNKFPALRIEGDLGKRGVGMYDMMNGIGAHEVIIETPNHNETIDTMSLESVRNIVIAYRERILDLKKDSRMKYVLVFKNWGLLAGASLEHTHSQLIATPIVPKRIVEYLNGHKRYFDYRGRCIICDMVTQELSERTRFVDENKDFVVIEPFASRFPFETWIIPKNHQAHYEFENSSIYNSFADILRMTIKRLSIALNRAPYNFVLMNCSFDNKYNEYYHWHLEIIPRLTKIAGFEWGTGFYINPTLPEDAAKFLREVDM